MNHGVGTPKITDGLKKMEDLHKAQNASKEAVLVSQVHYTAAMMYHGSTSDFIDCQVDLFPHLFGDSKIAKICGIRSVTTLLEIELIGFDQSLNLSLFYALNNSDLHKTFRIAS